jgi:hypothetical protein
LADPSTSPRNAVGSLSENCTELSCCLEVSTVAKGICEDRFKKNLRKNIIKKPENKGTNLATYLRQEKTYV